MKTETFRSLAHERLAAGKPRTWAILRDLSRKGGVRVVRVFVAMSYDKILMAAVDEITTGTVHFVSFSRLCKFPGRSLRNRISWVRTHQTAPDEKSAVAFPLAGAGAVSCFSR